MPIGLLLLSMLAGGLMTSVAGIWLPLGFLGAVFVYGVFGAVFLLLATIGQVVMRPAISDTDNSGTNADQRATVTS